MLCVAKAIALHYIFKLLSGRRLLYTKTFILLQISYFYENINGLFRKYL